MDIEIDLTKSVDENAILFFEKSKETRKKVAGLRKAILLAEKKAKEKSELALKQKLLAKQKKLRNSKTRWFFSFRWFFSSDNLLVVGGKDASSNEQLVKNRMKENDVYFHADVFGAPHCFIFVPKEKGKDFVVPSSSLKEAAVFAATFSRAWEENRSMADVYSVKPEQVSKSTKSGESLASGAFMIYGERNWFRKTPLSCGIGFFSREQKLMCAPISAIKTHCKHFFELIQGTKSKEVISKELKKRFESKGLFFEVDEFVSLLPNGKFEIK